MLLDLSAFEKLFKTELIRATSEVEGVVDPSHDILHLERIVNLSKKIGAQENALLEVVVPAAWFHDYVNVEKNDPRRSQASRLSAEKALDFLNSVGYPEKYFAEISHAIQCHSFSANIQPETLEARVVQDADRLDALGAIGIARCFTVAARMGRPFYEGVDPFAETRPLNDKIYTLDHFYQKLFVIAETLKTEFGREEGKRRLQFMQSFIQQFKTEISAS